MKGLLFNRLGEHRKMLAGFQQLLVDRAAEKDYTGQLSLAILKVCHEQVEYSESNSK
jgi:hypothetical protein